MTIIVLRIEYQSWWWWWWWWSRW